MALSPTTQTNFGLSANRIYDPLYGLSAKTSSVVSVGIDTGLLGSGSLGENIEQYLVQRDTGQKDGFWAGLGYRIGQVGFATGNLLGADGPSVEEGKPLTRDDWLESEYHREGLEYKDGLTTTSARALANRHDRDERRNFVMSKATGYQTGVFVTSTILSSMFDAKGVAFGLGAAGVVRGGLAVGSAASAVRGTGVMGRAVKSAMAGNISRATAMSGLGARRAGQGAVEGLKKFKPTLKTVGAEATLSSAAVAGTALSAADVLQADYTAADFAFDMAASIGISVGLSAFGKAAFSVWAKYMPQDQIDPALELALKQIEAGEKVDVKAAMEMQIAEQYVPLTTLPPEARVPVVTQIGKKKQYEAVYKNENGQYAVAKGRGRTQEEAVAELERVYKTADIAGQFNSTYTPEYYRNALNVQEIEDLKRGFDVEAKEAEEFKRITGRSLQEAEAEISRLEAELENVQATRGESQIRKAQKRLDKSTQDYDNAVGQARSEIDAQYSQITRGLELAKKDLIEMQKQQALPQFQQWTARQMSDSVENQAAFAGREQNNAAYVERANQAPKGDSTVASAKDSGEMQGLKEIMEDPNTPNAVKAEIEAQFKSIENARRMPQIMRRYLACRGGA